MNSIELEFDLDELIEALKEAHVNGDPEAQKHMKMIKSGAWPEQSVLDKYDVDYEVK